VLRGYILLNINVFSSFHLKEKSLHDVDDDVLLERATTPCSLYQVCTAVAGVVLVSISLALLVFFFQLGF
jgi:hypothetical protein